VVFLVGKARRGGWSVDYPAHFFIDGWDKGRIVSGRVDRTLGRRIQGEIAGWMAATPASRRLSSSSPSPVCSGRAWAVSTLWNSPRAERRMQ
jgi:hypothetical protein